MRHITWSLVYLYECYLRCASERPDTLKSNMKNLKYFYRHIYKQFEKVNQKALQLSYYHAIKNLKKWTCPSEPTLNINRFVRKISND